MLNPLSRIGKWITIYSLFAVSGFAQNPPLKIVILTGGHSFARTEFFSMFDGKYNWIENSQTGGAEVFEDITNWDYDVIVFYNLFQVISENQKQNFITLMNQGIGVVVLHHAVASYLQWPEMAKIVGCRYWLNGFNTVGDTTYELSGFWEGSDINIAVEDSDHSIVQGLPTNFIVHDEVYNKMTFEPDNHILLTSDNTLSDGPIAWTRTYSNSNIFFLQLGHGPTLFSDSNYLKILYQGIDWTNQNSTPVFQINETPAFPPKNYLLYNLLGQNITGWGEAKDQSNRYEFFYDPGVLKIN